GTDLKRSFGQIGSRLADFVLVNRDEVHATVRSFAWLVGLVGRVHWVLPIENFQFSFMPGVLSRSCGLIAFLRRNELQQPLALQIAQHGQSYDQQQRDRPPQRFSLRRSRSVLGSRLLRA